MLGFKTIFLEKFEEDIEKGNIKSICDFGSGESLNFIPLLEKYPDLVYVGIEPSKFHADRAKDHLSRFKNISIYNTDGYTPPSGEEDRWGKFDLVISLSVLEHIKRLEDFLKNSMDALRVGGRFVHRWDLGHALHPSSPKERLQVWLGNHFPSILPEHKFVADLRPDKVAGILEKFGAKVEGRTYHQMQDHKKFLQYLGEAVGENEKMVRELVEWDFLVSSLVEKINEDDRLKLFPAVALWGRKI